MQKKHLNECLSLLETFEEFTPSCLLLNHSLWLVNQEQKKFVAVKLEKDLPYPDFLSELPLDFIPRLKQVNGLEMDELSVSIKNNALHLCGMQFPLTTRSLKVFPVLHLFDKELSLVEWVDSSSLLEAFQFVSPTKRFKRTHPLEEKVFFSQIRNQLAVMSTDGYVFYESPLPFKLFKKKSQLTVHTLLLDSFTRCLSQIKQPLKVYTEPGWLVMTHSHFIQGVRTETTESFLDFSSLISEKDPCWLAFEKEDFRKLIKQVKSAGDNSKGVQLHIFLEKDNTYRVEETQPISIQSSTVVNTHSITGTTNLMPSAFPLIVPSRLLVSVMKDWKDPFFVIYKTDSLTWFQDTVLKRRLGFVTFLSWEK